MSGFTVVWTCYCSDANDSVQWLPETCPEHDRPRMADPYPNPNPGPVRAGHSCHLRGYGKNL